MPIRPLADSPLPDFVRTNKRAILYARVSTSKQREEGYSLATQLDACRRYAAEHQLPVVAEEWDDVTGTNLARPGLERVRQLLADRRADAVVFFSRDRKGRDLLDSISLRREWRKFGIEMHRRGLRIGRLHDC